MLSDSYLLEYNVETDTNSIMFDEKNAYKVYQNKHNFLSDVQAPQTL